MAKIATMQRIRFFVLMWTITVAMAACTGNETKLPADNLSSGTIDISVDESYQPIIVQQLQVFDSSFPEAHIKAHYKPESECIKDFMDSTARLILVTRDLSAAEKKTLEQQKVVATSLAIAKDAIAVILNNGVSDTVFGISQLKGILTGQYDKKYTVVFDNQGSSTLRYMLDSLIPGEKLGANVFAAKGNDSVVTYVANNPDAIGFVGVSTVSDLSDPEGLAFTDKVKVAAIYNEDLQQPYKPYQAFIANRAYPLTRNLFYIHRETHSGLGTGFANFLSKERGQLVFKQARLFPLRTNIILREAAVNP